MIKFFRQSYAIQYVVIALLAIALWLPSFLSGTVAAGMDSPVIPLYGLVKRILAFSPLAQLLFAFLLIVLEALIFNAILVNNQIIGKVSTMGAFVFVLLMSLTRTQADFYPFALSVVFILLIINVLFDIYLSQNPELSLLKAGILVALSSLCYFPSILLIVWVMAVLPIAKKGSFRLELIPMAGLLFTYFLYFVGVYLFGDFLSVIHAYQDFFIEVSLSVEGFNYKIIILLSFLILTSVLLLIGNAHSEKAVVRMKIAMSTLLVVFSVVLLFLGGNVLMNGLIFITLSILFSYEFTNMNNTGWANIVLALFLLVVFANHYYLKLL